MYVRICMHICFCVVNSNIILTRLIYISIHTNCIEIHFALQLDMILNRIISLQFMSILIAFIDIWNMVDILYINIRYSSN